MGIDAEMFVRVRRAVPDDEVRALRMALGGAFGAKQFWIFDRDKAAGEAPLDEDAERHDSDKPEIGRHCIERVTCYTQDGPSILPEPGETFLRVYPASRFYSAGYARGNLPFLLMLARFLRDRTGGEVWYGGDSSGVDARLLDDAYERELWSHFVEHQHATYETDWMAEGIRRPVCKFCGNVPMRAYGGGGNGKYAPFICVGCGLDIETRDGGETFKPRDKER